MRSAQGIGTGVALGVHHSPLPHSPHILLVEDEPTIVVPLIDDLEADGFAVTHTPDGAHAVALVAGRDFDAVITDLRLPGAEGVQVLRAIRRRSRHVLVVVITACLAGRGPELLRAGADTIFEKPFANHVVIDWLRAALGADTFSPSRHGRSSHQA